MRVLALGLHIQGDLNSWILLEWSSKGISCSSPPHPAIGRKNVSLELVWTVKHDTVAMASKCWRIQRLCEQICHIMFRGNMDALYEIAVTQDLQPVQTAINVAKFRPAGMTGLFRKSQSCHVVDLYYHRPWNWHSCFFNDITVRKHLTRECTECIRFSRCRTGVGMFIRDRCMCRHSRHTSVEIR